MIEAEALQELLEDLDLKNSVIDVARREIIVSCPLHADEKPSFSVALDKAGHPYNCYVCGGGSLLHLVTQLRECSYPEAATYISRWGNPDPLLSEVLEDATSKPKDGVPLPEPQESESLGAYHVWDVEGLNYLRKRRIPVMCTAMRRKRILWDRHTKSLIFPWWWDGVYYGASFRRVRERYRGTPVNKGLIPYSPTGVIHEDVVLVEGEIDAIKVSLAYPSVIALGSSKPSVQVLTRLYEMGVKRLFYFYDNNEAGRQGLIASILRVERAELPFAQHVVPYPRGSGDTDPAELTRRELRRMLDSSKSLSALTCRLEPFSGEG